MTYYTRLTVQLLKATVKFHKKGLSNHTIGKLLHLTPERVRQILKSLIIIKEKKPPKRGHYFTSEI